MIKKVVGTTVVILIVLASLQVKAVQERLIALFAGKHCNVTFSESIGLFPFNFSLRNLRISKDDLSINIDKLYINFGKWFSKIKEVSAGNIDINSNSKDTEFSASNLGILVPILTQDRIKKVSIEKLNFSDEPITNLRFTYDKKVGIRYLSFDSRLGTISSSWRFDKGVIFANSMLGDFSLQAVYETVSKHINLDLNYENKKFALDGIFGGQSLNAIITLPFYDLKINSSIKIVDGLLKAHCYSSQFDTTIDISFDQKNKTIFVSNFSSKDSFITVKPFVIKDDFSINNLEILFKKGKIAITDINLSSEKFSLGNAKISDVDISLFSDADIGGYLNGTCNFSNGLETAKLYIKNFIFDSFKIPVINIAAKQSKDKLNISLDFDFLKKHNNIKTEISAENWIISSRSSLNMRSKGEFNIADYKLAKNQIASGRIIYDINATGTLKDPILAGAITLKNGTYAVPLSGTYLRDITLNCAVANKEILIKNIYLRDDSKNYGTVRGSGIIKTLDGKLDVNISIKADRLKAFEQKWLDARLFGNATIKGSSFDDISISGDLFTENPKIDISSLVILTSRAIELIDTKENHVTSVPQKERSPVKWPININFKIVPNLQIVGFGVDSTWTGGAKLSGFINDIKYDAKISLQKGRVRVSENDFKLKSGEILFDGNVVNVNVAAEKRVDTVLVGARFIQDKNGSKVNFYSTPYLSNKDVLSYMLFGKPSAEISTSEALTLFSVMNNLSGTGGFDIISKMKSILGIDSIVIKKNKDTVKGEYNSVSIGKKIGKVRVSVDQGAAADTTNVTVEAKLAKNFKVSVDLNGKDSIGAGVSWNKRY